MSNTKTAEEILQKNANKGLTQYEYILAAMEEYANQFKPITSDNSFEEEAAELYPYDKGNNDGPIQREKQRWAVDALRKAYIKGRQKTTSLERDRLARKIITDFQVFIENNNGQFPGEGFIEDYISNLNKK